MGLNTLVPNRSIPVTRNSLKHTPRPHTARAQDGGTTSPTLLGRVADWRDAPAWRELFARYDPLLRRWAAGSGLDGATVDEVCQRIWVELADRLRTFRYDPSRSFRGWLRELCRSRIIDLARQRQREGLATRPLSDEPESEGRGERELDLEPGEDVADQCAAYVALLREAEHAQRAVREKVDARTWQAYWQIAIENRSVRETATALGMSYAAAYAARTRVHERLRAEGTRRLPLVLRSTGSVPA